MSFTLIVYILTLLTLLVIVLTRVRLLKENASGRYQVNRSILNFHTGCGVVAFILWVVFLYGQHADSSLGSDYLGVLALAFYWLTALAGLALLARWLPSSGRHAQASKDDDWGEGPGLALVAHLGMVVGVIIFTIAFATGSTTSSTTTTAPTVHTALR